MKLLKVVLDNVFAYDGEAVFDLSMTTEQRNLILIWGQNGVGKTSFLNAVKLFFKGPTAAVRTVGFLQRKLSISQYLLGDGTSWTGLVNRSARKRFTGINQPVEASISITWDEQGVVYTGVRWWTLHGTDISDGIYIDRQGGERVASDAAEDVLQHIIPSDFVDFFFFDGEDIKSIAENSGSNQAHFDRLLQTTFVQDVAKELENLAKERRRRNLEGKVRDRLDTVRFDLSKSVTATTGAKERQLECEDQLGNDGIELRRLQLRRSNLGSGANALQREGHEKNRKDLSDELERLTEEIVKTVPADVPILANIRMLKPAVDQVEARLAAGTTAEAAFVRGVSIQMPDWVSDAAPELLEAERRRIAEHLIDRLRATLEDVSPSGLFAQADQLRMARLREALDFWSVAASERRESQIKLLMEAYRVKTKIGELDDILLRIEVGSQANIEEIRAIANRIAQLEESIALRNQEKGALNTRIKEEQSRQAALVKEVAELEASQSQVTNEARDYRVVMDLSRTLNEIAEALRRATREELEELLNNRFRMVISHELIGRITVDDAYVLSYEDRQGKILGRSSISSGMKQLVATAFLWAMKDSAGADMPVIIDTPLGRIDRENQDHLLRNYYPTLSHQVIVLPTNSEIDARKLAILAPHIARSYTIVNDSGDAARVETRSLVGDT
ncbi:DNA sulfur modification protein DndD [Mesorhizobium sp. M0053]|uniref:DNA sulfur modification protein DndD n=1 Tax=Mesorhizobium sp. M0053 TaxID=2956864 RepID=UPI003334C5A6